MSSSINLVCIRLVRPELAFVDEPTPFHQVVSKWLETFQNDLVIVLNTEESKQVLHNQDDDSDVFRGISWGDFEDVIISRIEDALLQRLGVDSNSNRHEFRFDKFVWDAYEHEAATKFDNKAHKVHLQFALIPELLKVDYIAPSPFPW